MPGIENSQTIIELCEKYWNKHQKNCSGFVIEVASELGVSLSGQANDIIDQIQNHPWKILKSGVEAKVQATLGNLVIGGLKAHPNGHVVVVVAGPLAHGKYPTAYWGSLGGVGKKNTTINWSWSQADRDRVIYASKSIE